MSRFRIPSSILSLREPRWRVCALAVAVAGLFAWLLVLLFGDTDRAWRSLLINFSFFASLAAAMVTWPAVITAANGEGWLKPVRPSALAAWGAGPVIFAALIVLWLGVGHWAPWVHEDHLHNSAWLNIPFMCARDFAALFLFYGLATLFVARAWTKPPRTLGVWVILAYCLLMSLIGFDLIMALDPHWYSALFGGYYFISGMYIGIAGWTMMTLVTGESDRAHRHDMGKLIVAFSLLTTYFMFSQLIVIWYENLPHETRFVIPRMRHEPWYFASVYLLFAVYLGPLLLLLLRRGKTSFGYLYGMSAWVLAGMWVERWWQVTPTLADRFTLGLPEIALAAAFAGAFIAAIGSTWRRYARTSAEEAEA